MGLPVFMVPRGDAGPPPLQPPGPAWGLWLMQEGAGQTIADASGNGRTMRLGSSVNPESSDPAWVNFGGVVCLEFAAAHFCTIQTGAGLAQPYTVYVLTRRSSSGPESWPSPIGTTGTHYFCWRSDASRTSCFLGSNFIDGPFGASNNAWHVLTLVGNGASTRQRCNLGSSVIGNAGTGAIGIDMRAGARTNNTYYFNGLIAAVAVVPGALSESEDEPWYNYLRAVKGVT